jgi:hypothetical protein
MASVLAWLATLALLQDRVPEPDAATIKENQKTIRDLFKEDYAKKSPAEQKALAQKLYVKAAESKADAQSQYALLLEARDVAAGCNDVETAVGASDVLAKTFAVDGPALKLAALAKIAATAKDPETARSCTRALLVLIPDALRTENYDTALGAAQKAESLAKPAQDVALLSRATDLRTDAASLKAEAARVKPLMEKPAPTDEESIGRYLCFVKGDWNAGLPHLLAGSKAPLKPIVEKDVLKPVDADKQLDLGEAWIDFAQKEKSPWRRNGILVRARFWLEQAAETATGLQKMRIEKRLADTGPAEPGAVNLLRLIDAKEDAVEGVWTLDGAVLVSPVLPWARVQIPYAPPDEYELSVTLERSQGDNAVGIGLVHGGTFAMLFDTYPASGGKSGLDTLDGLTMDRNPLAVNGLFIKNNVPLTIVVTVRKSGVTATIDSKVVYSWQGEYRRLSPSPVFKPKDPRMPVVGAFDSSVRFTKITLTPISGQGMKLR